MRSGRPLVSSSQTVRTCIGHFAYIELLSLIMYVFPLRHSCYIIIDNVISSYLFQKECKQAIVITLSDWLTVKLYTRNELTVK